MSTTTDLQKTGDQLPAAKPMTPAQFINQPMVKEQFLKVLGESGNAFTSSIVTLINQNEKLKECTPESVYMCAMMAATLKLPINQNLGYAYIIPFKANNVPVATFQIGYKGLIQLAQRTGLYKNINTAVVYEGQLISDDPLMGYEFNFRNKSSKKVIGYAAVLKLISGFEKIDYMSIEEVTAHGQRFSKTYSSGPWKTDFDSMAQKTVMKRLLAKYGPMSVETQQIQLAINADQAVIKDIYTEEFVYPDRKDVGQIDKGENSMKVLEGKLDIKQDPEQEEEDPGNVDHETGEVVPDTKPPIVGTFGTYKYVFTATENGSILGHDNQPITVLPGDEAIANPKVTGLFQIGLNYIKEPKLVSHKDFKKMPI